MDPRLPIHSCVHLTLAWLCPTDDLHEDAFDPNFQLHHFLVVLGFVDVDKVPENPALGDVVATTTDLFDPIDI